MNGVEWEQRLDQLPTALAVALRLHTAGHADAVVGTALGVPVEAVAALLEVARAKLDHLPDDGLLSRNQWSITEGGILPGT